MYLVMAVQKELDNFNVPIQKIKLENKDQGLIGMCPIFDSEENARKIFPNAEIIKVNNKDGE